MDTLAMIMTPLMGAVIGYFTNWIAIKMLFRPYGEKYIWGFKIPFTPGLIPKERAALAKKVGETTAKHVLTDEVLAASLMTEEINDKLETAVNDGFIKLRQNDRTVSDMLTLLKIDMKENGGTADDYLTGLLRDQLQKESFEKAVGVYMTDAVVAFLQSQKEMADPEKIFSAVKNIVDTKGKALLRSEDFADKIRSYTAASIEKLSESEKLFSDIVPEKLLTGLEDFIKARLLTAGGDIEKLFDENPLLDEKLRQLIHTMAEENFGKLLGIFVNYDKIYLNLKKNLMLYLSDPQNQAVLVSKLGDGLNKLLASDFKSVLARMPAGYEKEISEKITAFLQSTDRDTAIDGLLSFLQNKLPAAGTIDLYQFILKIEPDFREKLSAAMMPIVKKQLFPAALALVSENLPKLRQTLLDTKINRIILGLSVENETKIKAFANKALKAALENGGRYVIQNIDIGKMIENKINEFEVDEAEKIIVSVVNRELNAITWLGGLLGLIIGFVPVIMELFG